MARVKGGPRAHARHRKVIKAAKGYYGRRKSCFRTAVQAVEKAGQYAYRDRRTKKRVMRRLWITRLNIAVREHGLTYRALVHAMRTKDIGVDRKVLSEMAVSHPKIFEKFLEKLK